MNDFTPPQIILAEIEALQDEVLRQLDALNLRIERTLAEFGGAVAQPDETPATQPMIKQAGRLSRAA